ncbi:hypothetical protein DUNSADRAFT_10705, partial [Dunaliella salina]
MVRTSSVENAAAAEREKQQGGDEGSSLKRGRGKASNAAAVHSGIPKAPEAAGGSPTVEDANAAPQKKQRFTEGAEGEQRSPMKGKAKGKDASKEQSTAAGEVKDVQETDQKQENQAAGGTEGSSRRRAAARGNKAYKDEGPV